MQDLFLTFLQIGLFTFGGGYAMIAQIKEKVVEQKQWLTEDELTEVIAIAESTPGPIAINLATFVGYKKRGFLGSLLATAGVILPSMVILYVISLFFDAFLQNPIVAYAFKGIKCAVAFLILRAGLEMLKKLPKKPVPTAVLCIVFTAMVLLDIFSLSLSPILFILAGGFLGIALYANPKKGKVDK